jgi:hypothetical protein
MLDDDCTVGCCLDRRVLRSVSITAAMSLSDATIRFMSVNFLNLAFALSHSLALPYRARVDNAMEGVSLITLTFLSSLLVEWPANPPVAVQIAITTLVLVPAIGMIAITVSLAIQRARARAASKAPPLPSGFSCAKTLAPASPSALLSTPAPPPPPPSSSPHALNEVALSAVQVSSVPTPSSDLPH